MGLGDMMGKVTGLMGGGAFDPMAKLEELEPARDRAEMKNYIERDAEQLRSRLPRLTTKVTIVFGENDSFAKVEDMVATDA